MNRLASVFAGSPLLPSSKLSRFALAVAFTLLALLVLVVAREGHHANSQLLSDLLQSAIVASAAACALWVTGRSTGYLRRLWLLFTVSLLLVVVAQVLETYYEGLAHTPFATPWPSDVGFILWVIPALIMLLPRPDKEHGGIDWETILDFAQVGIVALTAYLYFFYLTSRWESEGPQMVTKEIWLQIYRDLAIAAAFLLRSRASVSEPAKVLFRRVSLFFLFATGASMTYLLSGQGGTGRANWYDVAWCGPYLFVTAFATQWKAEVDASAKEQAVPGRAAIFSRMVPVCVPLLVLLMSRRIAYEQATLAWAAITASFLVSTTRLILTNAKQLRVADALRVSEERFRTLVQDLHIGIVLLGPNAETLFANRSVLETFGVRSEQVAGKSSAQFEATAIREDGTEMPFSERPAPRAIATKQPVYGEVVGWRLKGSDGVVWTLVDALPQITQQGEVADVILSISDITERKKAEEALQRSEERFRTLVESLHVGVALMGPRAEILFANQAALEIFGLSLEQVLGKTSEEFGFIALREDGTEIPFERRPAPMALATGQPVRNQVMGWRRPGSGEVLWILGEVVPLSTKDGKPDRLVAAFSDITQRKEAEESLHQLSARLLRLQDEERRRLGRELHDSLAQSVMAVNLDLAQITRSSMPLDKSARHALSEARKVLREMSREIRTLSYLLHPPVLDELGLASAVKEYASGFSERSGIALEIDIQPNFPRMPQEAETAFFRIVQESLANIQKHSGSPTGTIRLWNGQGRVQLEIRDQGRGMAAKPRGGGGLPEASRLGVGILGMRERMAQLGGTLEVQSNASGTAVHATIPLVLEGTHGTPPHPRG